MFMLKYVVVHVEKKKKVDVGIVITNGIGYFKPELGAFYLC